MFFKVDLELTNCGKAFRNKLTLPSLQWKQIVQRDNEYKGCFQDFQGVPADMSLVQLGLGLPSELNLKCEGLKPGRLLSLLVPRNTYFSGIISICQIQWNHLLPNTSGMILHVFSVLI